MTPRGLSWLLVIALHGAGCADLASDGVFDEPNPVPGSPAPSWPTLRSGDHGDQVLAAQHLLRHRGQRPPLDGELAAATANAVLGFQQASGLIADGVIGERTWRHLIAEVKPGDADDAVAAVQVLLANRHGYEISIDGRASEPTATALAQFQEHRCLAATGVAGLYTWSALLTGHSYCEGSLNGQLTMAQVVALARSAGLPCGDRLGIAGAIARAESALRSDASHRNGPTAGCPTGSTDVGLWQINDCYHPEVSADCALDPVCNAGAMYQISKHGTDWTPWSTYQNDAYRAFLTEAQAAADLVCP